MGDQLDKVHAAIKVQKQAMADLGDEQVKKRQLMAERFELLADKRRYLEQVFEERYETVSYDLRRYDDTLASYQMLGTIIDTCTSDLETAYRCQYRQLDDESEAMEAAYRKRYHQMADKLEVLKGQQWPAFEADMAARKKMYD